MNENYSNDSGEPNEDAKQWDILTEDPEEITEGEYDVAPAENPDGVEMQMSVPEENLPHQEIYETVAADDYDGMTRFATLSGQELRDALRNTMQKRASLAKQGLTPMDIFCSKVPPRSGESYAETQTASGIYDSDLEDLIETSIDEQTTAEEILKLESYTYSQAFAYGADYNDRIEMDQRRERLDGLYPEIFQSFLEHASKDFFTRDDESTTRLLDHFLTNPRRYGFENPITLIEALRSKDFTFGPNANLIIERLAKRSSETLFNMGGEGAFSDPEAAKYFVGAMSEEVQAAVVGEMLKNDDNNEVNNGNEDDNGSENDDSDKDELERSPMGRLIRSLPPEQVAKLLRLATARSQEISQNNAEL